MITSPRVFLWNLQIGTQEYPRSLLLTIPPITPAYHGYICPTDSRASLVVDSLVHRHNRARWKRLDLGHDPPAPSDVLWASREYSFRLNSRGRVSSSWFISGEHVWSSAPCTRCVEEISCWEVVRGRIHSSCVRDTWICQYVAAYTSTDMSRGEAG